MFSKITFSTVAALSAASLVSAAPSGGYWYGPSQPGNGYDSAPSASPSKYLYPTSSVAQLSFPTGTLSNNVFSFPLSNGFPSALTDAAIVQIEKTAGGNLTNSPTPPSVTDATLQAFRLLSINEISEVAFYTAILEKIVSGDPNWTVPAEFDTTFFINNFVAIQAQEQLHAISTNNALTLLDKKNVTGPIGGCQFKFPVDNLLEAIETAQMFTDVVCGTIADLQTLFNTDGDGELIRGLAGVLGQEGQQDGFFRILQGKRPSAQAFLTAFSAKFAFSTLFQKFVVPGTCAQSEASFGYGPVLGALEVVSPIQLGVDSTLTFQAYSNTLNVTSSLDGLQLVLVSGASLPIVEPINNVTSLGSGNFQFTANFPAESKFFNGLVVGAVTTKATLNTIDDVSNAAIFGPALIETD